MATVKRRSEVVSVAALSRSIDKAVAIAAKRHDAALASGNLIVNWEILGRVLRELRGGDWRLDLATTIVKNISAPLVGAQPVVTRVGKDVVVGFVERGGLRSF